MRFLYAAAVSSPNGLRQEVRSREGPLPIFIPLFCPRKRTQKERRGESCFDMTSASLSLSPFCLQFLRLLVLFDSIVFLIVVVFFFFFFYTSAVLIARHVAVCKDDFSFSFFSSCPAKNITRDGAVLSDTCYESSRGVTPSSQVVFIVGDAKKPVCLNLFLCVCFFFLFGDGKMWTEGIFKGCAQTHATGPAGDDRQKKAKEPSLAADVALCVCAQYFF